MTEKQAIVIKEYGITPSVLLAQKLGISVKVLRVVASQLRKKGHVIAKLKSGRGKKVAAAEPINE